MVKYKIYGDQQSKWICIAGCFENTYYTKDDARRALKGEPERCLVDAYDFSDGNARGYAVACRFVLWCVGNYGILADDILPEEKMPLLYGVVSNNQNQPLTRRKLPLKEHLSEYSPTWQDQAYEKFGSVWRLRIRTSQGRVYAADGKKEIEILP